MDDIYKMYESGMSIPEVSSAVGIPRSTVRLRLLEGGILRTRAEGIRIAQESGKLGVGLRGKKRVFTERHLENLRAALVKSGEERAKGTSLKASGYVEYTRGAHKGKSVHVVAMEMRLGRELLPDECVHHIDENKSNNEDNNLALMTRSGHTRHHKMIERLTR